MRTHPYLRAYMAGIVLPTAFLLVIMTVDVYHRYYLEVSSQFVLGMPARPLERTLVFPMAICSAPGFLDSGLTVFASMLPRPTRRSHVAPERGFDSGTSLASTARCTSA